jgi:hypothetical protein
MGLIPTMVLTQLLEVEFPTCKNFCVIICLAVGMTLTTSTLISPIPWAEADLVVVVLGLPAWVQVAAVSTLSEEEVDHLVAHSEAQAVVVASAEVVFTHEKSVS